MTLQVAGVGECRTADMAAMSHARVRLGDVASQPRGRHEALPAAVADVPRCVAAGVVAVPQHDVTPEVHGAVEAAAARVAEQRLETGVRHAMGAKVARGAVALTAAITRV